MSAAIARGAAAGGARAALALAASLALVGCGASAHTRAGGAVAAVAVRAVPWNPAGAQVGHVRAVADAGSVVAVFGDAGATVLSSGAVVAVDRAVTDWVGAQSIRGADGSARWIVGVDGAGKLYYLRGLSAFDEVSSRYGLTGARVLGVAALDAARVAFLLDRELAVADGRRVARYGAPALATLLGGGGMGAGVVPGVGITELDAGMVARTFPLTGVIAAALGPDGRLYAATPRALYASTGHGDLGLVYDAAGETLHGLVVSGDHVWFADGGELGVVDGERVAETRGAGIAASATLASSPSGDVWVLGAGALQRFARVDPEAGLGVTWSATLAPIFARSCSSCHLPGGVSGTDLSSAEAWQSERAAIRERVVQSKTMPPEGHALGDADRAAIAAWVGGR